MSSSESSTRILPHSGHKRAFWQQPPNDTALAFALARAARAHTGLLIVVARDTHQAQTLESDLRIFASDLPVLHFPDWEMLPYDLFSPHPDIVSQRIGALYNMPGLTRGLLVVPIATLMQRLAPRSYISGSSLVLKRGQTLDLDSERRRLEGSGYRHVPQVLDPGDFAVRGALLDLYPAGSALPYRIELLDTEVDTIRTFDPETQRSLDKVDSVQLLPAREFPLDNDAVRRFRNALREGLPIDIRKCPLYQDIKEGTTPAGIEYYLPLFFDHTDTLFDYAPANALFALAEGVLEASESFWKQTGERFENRRHDIERPVLDPAALFLAPDALREQLNLRERVEVVAHTHARFVEASDLGLSTAPVVPLLGRAGDSGATLRAFVDTHNGAVLIAADSAGRREAVLEQLSASDLHPVAVANWSAFEASVVQSTPAPSRFAITVAALEDGFAASRPSLVALTERQLFPERAQQSRRRKRAARDPESLIRDLTDIAIGAPIVHEDHGVGRYRGLITIEAGGTSGEFLEIEYAKGDKLFVPVAQLQLVGRYSGAAPDLAPLHSLGGEAWERARKKAAERIRDVAAELLDIQSRRQARQGRALEVDRAEYDAFAARFPFEETADQQSTIEAVIADLAREQPMDRVVCGDVGFGKTEVAVRAAYVAAVAGKQVALLVPTTLLAQQHYQNFADRFADWPVRVEVLSRFKSPKESKELLTRVAEGRVDILIGTHRLLQPDVKFKDLGLVIVDEEQRFGVRQKEILKKLRAEVHLLTMTATPIPRTLNMAMAGLRDLSIIATPPANRLAVQTFVTQWDPALLREAFQRELARGGQVYFLHNEVTSIERIARELEVLVPEARIRFAHGQMPERELEHVMLDFYRQRFNVLVCTTIIESGIDIPSANTIIIDRADRFGLSQLHQLRGRVGRSHHRAYAYLVVPERKAMTSDAEKRLEAIASLEELGAGFALATHDLEIRGAGELLGEEQSGQINEVGFSLYTDMLERAVRALRAGRIPDFDLDERHGAEVELHAPALIPDDYLHDVQARLTLYKRIASASSAEGLRELQVEMIDRFGLLPLAVKQLFAVTELKLVATPIGVRKLELGANGGRLVFTPKPSIDGVAILRLVSAHPGIVALDGADKLRITRVLDDGATRVAFARELLAALTGATPFPAEPAGNAPPPPPPKPPPERIRRTRPRSW